MEIEDTVRRTLISLFILLFYLGWIITQYRALNLEWTIVGIYGALTIICILGYYTFDKWGGKKPVLYGFEDVENSIRDIFIGVFAGVGFIFVNKINPAFSLALPFVPYALSGRWLVIVTIAPIVEEYAFRGLLLSLLESMGISFGQANVMQALGFAAYHIVAYATVIAISAILSVSGAFIAAMIAGIMFGILTRRQKNPIASMAAHIIFNGFLMTLAFVVL